MAYCPSVASPHAWLHDAVEQCGLPQAALARLLGVDRAVFGRYLRGEEQIPRLHLAKLAQELNPEEYDYALCLKDCEDLTDALRRSVVKLAANLRAGLRGNPHKLSKRQRQDSLDAAAEEALVSGLTEALL